MRRVKGEYLEMPGLQLTYEQAQRLWGLDGDTCRDILDTLVRRNFLVRGPDARYRRLFDGAWPRAPHATARVGHPAARMHRKAG